MSRILRILIVIVLMVVLYLIFKYRRRTPRMIRETPEAARKISRRTKAGGLLLFTLVIAYLAITYHEWFRWSLSE